MTSKLEELDTWLAKVDEILEEWDKTKAEVKSDHV
jgi:hypothetical protein